MPSKNASFGYDQDFVQAISLFSGKYNIIVKLTKGNKMDWIINVISLCFIIYAVVIVKKSKTSLRFYLKVSFNEYTSQDIIVGFFIGLFAMVGIYCVELNLNYIKIQNINLVDGKFVNAFFTLLVMAFAEELLFRGFMLTGLIRILKKKYIAVIITAVLFGLAHASNPNATPISVISNGLGGVMYSIAFIESESIWLPFALHFSWNFFQGPVFGFPVSGLSFGGIVQQSFVVGKNSFTGGGYGPEGGMIGISFRIAVIIMLLLYYKFNIKKRTNLIPISDE